MDKKRIVVWGGFIIALGLLLFGLAKIGEQPGGFTEGQNLLFPVSESDWSLGSPTAPHTLVEYSDFQCPACGAYYPLIKRLASENGNDVRVIFRHFPLEGLHPNAKLAAIAAEAAGKQGKFFEMHDALFNTQGQWGVDENPKLTFEDLAGSLGMNGKQFTADMNNPDLESKVRSHINQANQNGLNATPSLFLDGVLIQNPNSYEELVKLVTGK